MNAIEKTTNGLGWDRYIINCTDRTFSIVHIPQEFGGGWDLLDYGTFDTFEECISVISLELKED